MLSRIAESLFWLARYIERAEYTARILDVNFHTVLEQSKDKYRLHWDPLIVMAGRGGALPGFVRRSRRARRIRISRLSPG